MQALLSRGSMQSSHGAAASSDNVDGGQSAADDAAPGSDSALTGLQDPDAARASGATTAVHAAVARSSGQQARVVALAVDQETDESPVVTDLHLVCEGLMQSGRNR